MATNFVQVGDIIEVTAPSGGCTAGLGYLIGAQLFGVALTTVASGSAVNIGVTGVWTLPKVTTVAHTLGDKLWWDNSDKTVTKTSGSNVDIGIAVADAVETSTTTTILLQRVPQGGA